MTVNHCIDCKFFVDFERMGECRRFPTFQHRSRVDWCGEFATKPVISLPVIETSPVLDRKKPGRPKKNA